MLLQIDCKSSIAKAFYSRCYLIVLHNDIQCRHVFGFIAIDLHFIMDLFRMTLYENSSDQRVVFNLLKNINNVPECSGSTIKRIIISNKSIIKYINLLGAKTERIPSLMNVYPLPHVRNSFSVLHVLVFVLKINFRKYCIYNCQTFFSKRETLRKDRYESSLHAKRF